MIPRIHPQLEIVRKGWIKDIRETIQSYCKQRGVRIVSADKEIGEHLCLAADVIFSVSYTEDIKNTLMGGPPIVHFIGPKVQEWFGQKFFLKYPYLFDVQTGQALAVFSLGEISGVLKKVLDSIFREKIFSNRTFFKEKAAYRTAKKLIEIVLDP